MQVIAHQPHFWFFLQHENQYYLDIYCSYSIMSFGRLIQLTEAETKEYLAKGNTYINALAEGIQYEPKSTYADRHITGEIGDIVHKTIMEYNAKNSI